MPGATPSDRLSDSLLATTGELRGEVSYNSLSRLPPGLRHHVTIDFAPVTYRSAIEHPQVRLYSLDLGVRSWRALPGRRYTYPRRPPMLADGEPMAVDDGSGAVLLAGDHLPVQARSVAFRVLADQTLITEFELSLELEAVGLGTTEVSCLVPLVVGKVVIRGDTYRQAPPDADEVEQLAARFLDLEDYRRERGDGLVEFHPVL